MERKYIEALAERVRALEVENAELRAWREGKKGVEEYYAQKYAKERALAEVARFKAKYNDLLNLMRDLRIYQRDKSGYMEMLDWGKCYTLLEKIDVYLAEKEEP